MKPFAPEIQELINIIYRGGQQRKDAFNTLKSLQSAESTRALLRLLDDYRVPPFYVAIIHELGQRGALDALHYFRDILQSDAQMTTHTGNQLTAIETLAEYGEHSATIPLLAYTLKNHKNHYVLRQCVYTLGQIGDDDAIYLLSLLMHQHPDARVRHDAIMVLGSTRNARAVDVLLNYLERDDNLTEEGQPAIDCVNAMNSLLRLWKAEVQPFDVTRWLHGLTYWLYSVNSDYPKALYTLKKIAVPEAEHIIQCWQQSRIENNEGFFC